MTSPLASIVVVEDDAMICSLLVDIFEEAGYQVAYTAKPSEALRMIDAASAVDIVLTDYNLPEMNGVELIRKIMLERPDTAFVLASGNSFGKLDLPSDRIRILTKPFLPEELLDAAQKLLALKAG